MPNDKEELLARFAALIDHVRQWDGVVRPKDQQQLLLDQLRNALDRAAQDKEHLTDTDAPVFIAGTFVVEAMLYRGTYHEILKLRHRDLDSIHVLKTVRADQAASASRASLLRREAQIGLGLRDRYLVETSALLRLPDGRPGLLQPWSGESLSSVLSQRTLTVQDIKTIMQHLLLALASLHDRGYVHCDVSPSNIFITRDETLSVKLGDFGITLKTGQTHADLQLAEAYAPDYCAPEQNAAQPVHPSMDIYSAGRVLQHMMAGLSEDAHPDLVAWRDDLSTPILADRPKTARIALSKMPSV